MKKFCLILTINFLLFSASMAQHKTQTFNWKEFVSEEGKFKAVFPFVPVKTDKEIDAGIGKLQTTKFEISLSEPEIYFGVLYADFPNAPMMDEKTLRTNYDYIRDGFVKTGEVKLTSERDVWASGKLGREIVFDFDGKTILTYRTFLIETRQFQVISSTKATLIKDAEIKKSIDKFLDSFQYIEK